MDSASRPYRLNPKMQDILNEQIDELLEADIIAPSDTRWRSPTILVRKKCGSYRMCIDYRQLNKVTVRTPFPMNTREMIFSDIAYRKPQFYTGLDLLSGYYQQGIEEESQHLTGFATSRGNFAFKRTPFGLVNAPFAFSHLMSTVLAKLTPAICSAYLDDVSVYSPSFEKHVEDVNAVLNQLRKADLKLKPSKCEFAKSKIEFLGHVLTREGVLPQQRLLNKVHDFAVPTSVKESRRFVGMTSYYKAFIPNYSVITRPLYELTRKGKKFEWSERCQRAFSTLKAALFSPPILIHPDFEREFYLLNDASDYAVGAALGHKIDGVFRPCAFFGASLGGAELKYPVTEKECLSVFRALKHFHDLILGYKVIVVTDHKPLTSILENAIDAPTPRLGRWALYMGTFDFRIVYEPGRTHYLADYLSRFKYPLSEEEGESEPVLGIDVLYDNKVPHTEPTAHCLLMTRSQAQLGDIVTPPQSDDNDTCLTRSESSEQGSSGESTSNDPNVTETSDTPCDTPTRTGAGTPNKGKNKAADRDRVSIHNDTADDDRSSENEVDTHGQNSEPIDVDAHQLADDGSEGSTKLSLENIKLEQGRDNFCLAMIGFLTTNTLPKDPNLATQITVKSDYMGIGGNGLLYHYPNTRRKRANIIKLTAQIVLPPPLRHDALVTLHNDIIAGGHVGKHALTSKVTDRFFWVGMHQDIYDYTRSCNTCNLKKRTRHHAKSPMQVWKTPTYPFEVTSTDIMGPLKPSEAGNRYIITFTCHLTGWTEAFAMPDGAATTVADIIVTQIFTRYGAVRQLHSDRGANYCARLTRTVTTMLGCKQSFTTSSRAWANGRSERRNLTLNNILTSYDNELYIIIILYGKCNESIGLHFTLNSYCSIRRSAWL